MELAIPRATFGGELGDPDWVALSAFPGVPDNVAAAAREVFTRIGIPIGLQLAAENVKKMVAYFRAFVDSDCPLEGLQGRLHGFSRSRKRACAATGLTLSQSPRSGSESPRAWS